MRFDAPVLLYGAGREARSTRAFIKARALTSSHVALARELAELKKTVSVIDADTRRQFDQVYEAILGLMSEPLRKN